MSTIDTLEDITNQMRLLSCDGIQQIVSNDLNVCDLGEGKVSLTLYKSRIISTNANVCIVRESERDTFLTFNDRLVSNIKSSKVNVLSIEDTSHGTIILKPSDQIVTSVFSTNDHLCSARTLNGTLYIEPNRETLVSCVSKSARLKTEIIDNTLNIDLLDFKIDVSENLPFTVRFQDNILYFDVKKFV